MNSFGLKEKQDALLRQIYKLENEIKTASTEEGEKLQQELSDLMQELFEVRRKLYKL